MFFVLNQIRIQRYTLFSNKKEKTAFFLIIDVIFSFYWSRMFYNLLFFITG